MTRTIFFLVCAILAAVASYFAQPYMIGNADAILIIITVLTVFAGFLVAIITIIGDPAMVPEGSWRKAELKRDEVENRLYRQSWLFVIYLVAIGFLFIGALLHKAGSGPYLEIVKVWIERLYLFFGILSFLLTFALPGVLLKLQRARVDAEIERRRRAVNLPSKDDG